MHPNQHYLLDVFQRRIVTDREPLREPPISIDRDQDNRAVILGDRRIHGCVINLAIFVIVQILRRNRRHMAKHFVRVPLDRKNTHAEHIHIFMQEAMEGITHWNQLRRQVWSIVQVRDREIGNIWIPTIRQDCRQVVIRIGHQCEARGIGLLK